MAGSWRISFRPLFEESDSTALAERLVADHGLDRETIEALSAVKLGRATASVSRKFMEAIVPVLREQALVYADAVGELVDDDGVYLHHSHHPDSQDRDRLPYYGEILQGSLLGADPSVDPVTNPEKHFGKINNPTVHVALNSLRRVINVLVERFGNTPVQIHVELSRELKKTKKARDEDLLRQARNERENERIRDCLKEHHIANPSMLDIKKVKLWEELGKDELTRRCPFSGRPIAFHQLINGEAEIEHILPFRRTLDDSMNNLTVAMRWANRLKGNQTPHEAFSTDMYARDGITWETVRARGAALPKEKSWRFGPDAMKKFESDHDFIARQLTDNAYIAKAAARYLGCLKGVEQIVPNRGGLTALLRGKWRLNGILSDDNRKNREDHRHHAIDAAVIALGDRATLNAVSQLSARGADDRLHIAVPDLDPALEQAIRDRVPKIVVAHKPDHGWQAAMFKETAYGFVPEDRRDRDFPRHNLTVRKPLVELTPKEQASIRDRTFRRKVARCLDAAKAAGTKPEKALADFSLSTGVRDVRILVSDQTVSPVHSAPYKGYKADSYVCCDVWRCLKGKKGKWQAGRHTWQGVYWAYADTPNGIPDPGTRKPHPAARLVARLFKDDLVAYGEAGIVQIMRVAGFSTTNNKLDLSPHCHANSPQTYISVNVLGAQGLRKLHVGPDGRVRGLRTGARP